MSLKDSSAKYEATPCGHLVKSPSASREKSACHMKNILYTRASNSIFIIK